jgi:hypothetical protein
VRSHCSRTMFVRPQSSPGAMSDTSPNIDLFDEAVASIMGELYAQFPVKTHIDACEIAGTDDDDTCDVFSSTIEFLRSEGFLQYGQRAGSSGNFSNAILTLRGLGLLRSIPPSLTVRAPLGEQLKRALKDGGKEGAKALGRKLLETAVSPEVLRALLASVGALPPGA